MRTARRHRIGIRAACLMAALLMQAAAAPGIAQEPPAPGETEALGLERGIAALEELRAEIETLRALAHAQAALLAWNRARAGSGAGPAVLPTSLCAGPALAPWCRALPATFGAGAGEAADNGQVKEGER